MPSGLLINIDVPDLQAGISFYEKGLGFTFQRLLFDKDVAELSLGETRIFLLEVPEGSRAFSGTDIQRDYKDHWTPVHMDILVENMSEAVSRAVGAGARNAGDLQTHPYGTLMLMCDPFGHGFCFIEFKEGGYDNVVAGN